MFLLINHSDEINPNCRGMAGRTQDVPAKTYRMPETKTGDKLSAIKLMRLCNKSYN